MEERGTSPLPSRPRVVGEVLLDRFTQDGANVLGGAPFNVAWHLQGFGLQPLLISRVGEDALGTLVVEAMEGWGMDTTAVQHDRTHPTGVVDIEVRDGQPTFDICAGAAYDFIEGTAVDDALRGGNWSLLYHGSLASRHPVSRDALASIRRSTGIPAFVDINLRAPWWEPDAAREMLHGQRWVKLNEEELTTLLGDPGSTVFAAAQAARSRFDIGWLLVTLGAEGALAVAADRWTRADPVQVETLVDTVGAGDAFSAVTILGLVSGWQTETILARASAFAAAICGVRGATVADPAFYQHHLDTWGT